MAIEPEESAMDAEATRTSHQFSNPTDDDTTRMPNVPHEIVLEILTRLPVQSLSRFRCVCKSWLYLISDSKFIKSHLHMSTVDDDDYSRRRIIFTGNEDFRFKSCSLYSIFKNVYDEAIELDHPIKDSNRVGSIIGSYNGLVCISFIHEKLYLWNPSLRESRRLPHFGPKLLVGNSVMRYSLFGFGYDYSTDDYKVVALFLRHHHVFYKSEVQVYTLRTNLWRKIEGFPCGRPYNEAGKFVSGALHWRSRESGFYDRIIALDLATETYHEVAQPEYDYTDGYFDRFLGVLRGCLCVLINSHSTHAKIWVMQEYGVRESWTKLVTLPYASDFFPSLFDVPLFTSKNSEMLLRSGTPFKIYNSKDDTFKSPVIPDSLDNCRESAIYIESLVSPTAELLKAPPILKKKKVELPRTCRSYAETA